MALDAAWKCTAIVCVTRRTDPCIQESSSFIRASLDAGRRGPVCQTGVAIRELEMRSKLWWTTIPNERSKVLRAKDDGHIQHRIKGDVCAK